MHISMNTRQTMNVFFIMTKRKNWLILVNNNLPIFPGNATITYEVQLLDVREPPPQANVFGAMDGDGDKELSRDEVSEYMKKQAQMQYGAPMMDDEYWNSYHNQMVDNIFEQEDENEDGTISHNEFSGPKFHHEELWDTQCLQLTNYAMFSITKWRNV